MAILISPEGHSLCTLPTSPRIHGGFCEGLLDAWLRAVGRVCVQRAVCTHWACRPSWLEIWAVCRWQGGSGIGTHPHSAYFAELCPRHSPLDPTPHTLVQPISALLGSDPASCPHCQREAGQRPSGLGSPDSGQEGSGSSSGGENDGDEVDGDGARSSDDGASSGLSKEEEEEEQADGATWLCGDVWRETRAKLRGIVDSKYFNRGIMMAILVNTVSMGIEHHEQASAQNERGRWEPVGRRGRCVGDLDQVAIPYPLLYPAMSYTAALLTPRLGGTSPMAQQASVMLVGVGSRPASWCSRAPPLPARLGDPG